MCFFGKKRSKVPFTLEKVAKCVCPKCPVQAKSQCVSQKVSVLADALKKVPLKREDIPGLYCSTGKATCTDLNSQEMCICGSCPVWTEFKLAGGKPAAGHFCRDGKAA